mgnify:CR=1 FL=1
MKKTSYIIFLFCLLSFNLKGQSVDDFKYNWESEDQLQSSRKGLDSLKLINVLVSLDDQDLFQFAYIRADNLGNLVGYDFNKERVIYFHQEDYSVVREITDGNGRGPREMKLVRDIEFDKKGNMWIIDLEGGKITKWSKENELLKSFKPKKKYTRPYRIALCENSISILSEQYLGEGLYHKFDLEGNEQNSFMTLKNNNKDEFRLWTDASYFRGDLTCSNEKIYHVGRYKNYIRKYDKNGELLFSKKVIEFEGNPEPLLELGNRSSRRKDEVKTISGQIEVLDNSLLVSFSGKRNPYFYILDIYDLNGNYKISYQFNHPTKEFTTDGKFIYTLETHRNDKKQYIAKYRLPVFD